jgi:hypothetical protein
MLRGRPEEEPSGPVASSAKRRVDLPNLRLVRCPICGRRIHELLIYKHTENGTCHKRTGSALHPRHQTVDEELAGFNKNHLCLRLKDAGTIPCVSLSRHGPCCSNAESGFRAVIKLNNPTDPLDHLLVIHAALRPVSPSEQGDGQLLLRTPPDCPSRTLGPSVLKSALQKCVRRGRALPAVRLAIALMRKTSIVELLRRICVITIEDAALCRRFPVLVWFLAGYSRGYEEAKPRMDDVAFILETVALVALARVKDDGWTNCLEPGNDAVDHYSCLLEGIEVQELRCMTYALRVRASYGGTPWDVRMFQNAAKCWTRRFSEAPGLWTGRIDADFDCAWRCLPVNFYSIIRAEVGPSGRLRRGDIPLASIDFHCSRICEDLLSTAKTNNQSFLRKRIRSETKVGSEAEDAMRLEIKRLMWKFQSSVTDKEISWLENGELDLECSQDTCSSSGQLATSDLNVWVTELEPAAREWARSFLRSRGL